MTSACRTAKRRKGEPLVVMAVIIIGWVGLRLMSWESPVFERHKTAGVKLAAHGRAGPRTAPHAPNAPPLAMEPRWPMVAAPMAMDDLPMVAPGSPSLSRAPMAPDGAPWAALPDDHAAPSGEVALAGGHQLMWMAAMAHFPVPGRTEGLEVSVPGAMKAIGPDGGVAQLSDPRAAPLLGPVSLASSTRLARWSGDAWLLWREGGNSAPGAALRPSYGANQAGAVLRYRLASASAYRPTAYMRGYGAMNGTGEREAAAGFSARPIPRLPVYVMVEGRASRFMTGATHLRPAVAVVSEIAPMTLPGKLRAETYVQAGYVGGTGATPFVDGQFRLERVADRTGSAELRLGAGVWGGAQRGTGRLDMGPTATLAFAAGRVGAHLSLDWRFRVGGSALPGSGPAITLAAGF